MKARRGFTLIELLIVLAVVTGISLATLAYTSRSTQDSEVQQLVMQVRTIAERARSMFSDQATLYSQLSMDALVNGGAFDRNQMQNAFFLAGPSTSRMRVTATDRGGITGGAFQVGLFQVPRHLCFGLATRITPELFNEISINSVVIGNTSVGDPVTTSEVSAQCANSNNTMALTGS